MSGNAGPILVTGVTGQVGGALVTLAREAGRNMVAPTRAELDLTTELSVRDWASRDWAAIINCAAYTAVDKAESEPELAHCINAAAPALFAEGAARRGVPLIHVSTDYVFDGSKSSPYAEDDAVNPLGVYGRTKEAGEAAIRASGAQHAIVRTSWVVSAGGANFINTMLRLGKEREELPVVYDQIGAPTHATDLAAALLTIADTLGDRSGTWHFANRGEASWHELATRIFAATRARGMKTPQLRAIPAIDYPTQAPRPANSRLALTKIAADFGITSRHWEVAVDAILAERLGPAERQD